MKLATRLPFPSTHHECWRESFANFIDVNPGLVHHEAEERTEKPIQNPPVEGSVNPDPRTYHKIDKLDIVPVNVFRGLGDLKTLKNKVY